MQISTNTSCTKAWHTPYYILYASLSDSKSWEWYRICDKVGLLAYPLCYAFPTSGQWLVCNRKKGLTAAGTAQVSHLIPIYQIAFAAAKVRKINENENENENFFNFWLYFRAKKGLTGKNLCQFCWLALKPKPRITPVKGISRYRLLYKFKSKCHHK